MEITAILDSVKGKILDAANFTLLQAAYELQAQNIEQFNENNSVHRERSELLQEKIARLEAENQDLTTRLAAATREVRSLEHARGAAELSPAAIEILEQCAKNDTSIFQPHLMAAAVTCGRLQYDAAMEELQDTRLAYLRSDGFEGAVYGLTPAGMKRAMALRENS